MEPRTRRTSVERGRFSQPTTNESMGMYAYSARDVPLDRPQRAERSGREWDTVSTGEIDEGLRAGRDAGGGYSLVDDTEDRE
jgi:hypothetical protein